MGFEGLQYWSNKIAYPSAWILRDIPIWESAESNDASFGVRIILAPSPLSTFAFSADIFSGIQIMH